MTKRTDIPDKAVSLEEQLKLETRTCSRCHYEVKNPFILSCPRCSTPLPAVEISCMRCIHRNRCPVFPLSSPGKK